MEEEVIKGVEEEDIKEEEEVIKGVEEEVTRAGVVAVIKRRTLQCHEKKSPRDFFSVFLFHCFWTAISL